MTGFFDAAIDESTGGYDRMYTAQDFTTYFEQMIGSGVCVYGNDNSMKVSLSTAMDRAVIQPGYLFIKGYWLKNDDLYTVNLSGLTEGVYAICARLNLGRRLIELVAQPKSDPEADTNTLVLAYVTISSSGPAVIEDTRDNGAVCGLIDSAGSLSAKVEYALNYIDTEIDGRLNQIESDMKAQEAAMDLKIEEAAALIQKIAPPPIGSVKYSAAAEVEQGWLLCDGSFINDADYPELVSALGKHTPGVEEFKEVLGGKTSSSLSNEYLDGAGICWIFSLLDSKLYGYSYLGQITEVSVLGTEAFDSATINPITLSIVGGTLFLVQVNGKAVIMMSAAFTGSEQTITLDQLDIATIISTYNRANVAEVDLPGTDFTPEIVVHGSIFRMCLGLGRRVDSGQYSKAYNYLYTLTWEKELFPEASIGKYAISPGTTTSESELSYLYIMADYSRTIYRYSRKLSNEMVMVYANDYRSSGVLQCSVTEKSIPNGVYNTINNTSTAVVLPYLTVQDTIAVSPGAGNNLIINRAYIADRHLTMRIAKYNPNTPYPAEIDKATVVSAITLPSYSKLFPDSICYLQAQDLWIVFVGTGIMFSKTPLLVASWGYLDTQSVLGVITQYGSVEYDEKRNTLYISGKDTVGNARLGVMKFKDLYNYANNGAWLPMLAADGVPAYMKAKEPT